MSKHTSGGFVTELRARGHALLPAPRNVELADSTVPFDALGFRLEHDLGDDDIAVQTLRARLAEDFGVELAGTGSSLRPLRLSVSPGTVQTGQADDIDRQAYRLTIDADGIDIVANAPAGLFYGVQTFLQLLRRHEGGSSPTLPAGTITDWPEYALRIMHWDTKHHQDRMDTLKRYLDWAARLKYNAIAFELEDKFAYPTHPIIGAPGAFTTEQMQELVRYALDRHIQIIPNIQTPAHLCYALKHEQFAHLRCDGNNYMACMDNPEVLKLIFEMYEDVLEATAGVDYFLVSTDEVYYSGICEKYRKPYNPENRSLTWLDFVNKAHEFLTARGRQVIAWVEHPLLPEHVKGLPKDLIDGVGTGREVLIRAENEYGLRQIGYASMQGEELLFPNYFGHRDDRHMTNRLANAYEAIVRPKGEYGRAKWIGTFAAAWADAGLHNETFWLGWAAMAQNSWTPGAADVHQTVADFMDVYYGSEAEGMAAIYQDLQAQGRFWERSWTRVPSRVRGPAYGNSREKQPVTRMDRTLTPPALPTGPGLAFEPAFGPAHAEAMAEVPARLRENDRLIGALQANLARVRRNRYNLEVFLSLAHLIRHHLRLLTGLGEAEDLLARASDAAGRDEHAEAVDLMARAHHRAGEIIDDLHDVFGRLVATWEKCQFPRNAAVDGKQFIHVMDDVKDHFADRRADLSYMISPEESIGLGEWRKGLWEILSSYAQAHDVPVPPPEPTVAE